MTAATVPGRPDADRAPSPVPWRRMAWVTWRQHRTMLVGVGSVLAAASVFLLVAGLKVHRDYNAMVPCLSGSLQGRCGQLFSGFNQTDWPMGNAAVILMNFAPALLGAFSGPAVLGRELETGTYRYAWTQGIGRARWTAAKVVLLAVAVAVPAWAFSQLFAWFYDPIIPFAQTNELAALVFSTRGVAFAAWTVASFAIGAFLGLLLRRIIPAMAATLGACLGLAVLAWLVLRPHYPVSLTTSDGSLFAGQSPPDSPWVLSEWTTGTTHWWRYIPVSRFWPMQFIEAGWLLVLSALLLGGTVWLVRHRAA